MHACFNGPKNILLCQDFAQDCSTHCVQPSARKSHFCIMAALPWVQELQALVAEQEMPINQRASKAMSLLRDAGFTYAMRLLPIPSAASMWERLEETSSIPPCKDYIKCILVTKYVLLCQEERTSSFSSTWM